MNEVVVGVNLDVTMEPAIWIERNVESDCAVSEIKRLETCADCPDYPCHILETFYSMGRKKYRKQLDFIRHLGYQPFLKNSDNWKRASGKLIPP